MIAFAADWQSSFAFRLYTVPAVGALPFLTSPAGADPRLLVSADSNASSPSWSPDGSKIVVSMAGDLWIIAADGGMEEQITFGGGDDITPEWSPKGDEIAFASNPTGDYDIWILSLESLGMRQITNEVEDEYSPTWAPAGNALAFVRVLNDVRDLFAIYFAR